MAPLLDASGCVDVAFTPQRNDFRGNTEIEGRVVDVRPAQ